jgi:ERCC4-type nuclease
MPNNINHFLVIRDTREQTGWQFTAGKTCLGTKAGTLKTGDYTVEGYENLLSIERKGSVQEFAQNLMDDRFFREMERMKEYKYAYLVLEFTAEDLFNYPESANIPSAAKARIRTNGNFLMSKTMHLQNNYPIKVFFAGRKGKDMAYYIMKMVTDVEPRRTT